MGSRYLITGVQLGMIGGLISCQEGDTSKEAIKKLLDEVVDNQWICYSDNSIQNDVSNCTLTTIGLSKEK
jgi:hypothetical protein